MTEPLPRGSTIGILGGGQLGRMLASAAAKLGLKTHIYAPEQNAVAAHVTGKFTCAAYEDAKALALFAKSVDVITYEFENVPVETAEQLVIAGAILRPGVEALKIAQDRLNEKQFARKLDIATARYMPIASAEALEMAMQVTGMPAILKTRRFGYDGKGQAVIYESSEAADALKELANAPAILEGFVPFATEISVIVARGIDGNIACYDPPENLHTDGILCQSSVPAKIDESVKADAIKLATKIVDTLSYIGVLAVEFFVEKNGGLILNEIAPRVHNSGHWTSDACTCGQFEQHIRAISGWPLGSTMRHSDCIMKNLIGKEIEPVAQLAASTHNCVTDYGKGEPREGRKMGHVTTLKPRT
ncbi:MAG: 5-(carboxyamino)imidazole ribonucleotide synthase [Parvularculaceae bacterium]